MGNNKSTQKVMINNEPCGCYLHAIKNKDIFKLKNSHTNKSIFREKIDKFCWNYLEKYILPIFDKYISENEGGIFEIYQKIKDEITKLESWCWGSNLCLMILREITYIDLSSENKINKIVFTRKIKEFLNKVKETYKNKSYAQYFIDFQMKAIINEIEKNKKLKCDRFRVMDKYLDPKLWKDKYKCREIIKSFDNFKTKLKKIKEIYQDKWRNDLTLLHLDKIVKSVPNEFHAKMRFNRFLSCFETDLKCKKYTTNFDNYNKNNEFIVSLTNEDNKKGNTSPSAPPLEFNKVDENKKEDTIPSAPPLEFNEVEGQNY